MHRKPNFDFESCQNTLNSTLFAWNQTKQQTFGICSSLRFVDKNVFSSSSFLLY